MLPIAVIFGNYLVYEWLPGAMVVNALRGASHRDHGLG
jgi:hypothetical protein